MATILRLLAWVATHLWRYVWAAWRYVTRVSNWIRNNWRRVLEWINAGISFGTILEWVLRILGIG